MPRKLSQSPFSQDWSCSSRSFWLGASARPCPHFFGHEAASTFGTKLNGNTHTLPSRVALSYPSLSRLLLNFHIYF